MEAISEISVLFQKTFCTSDKKFYGKYFFQVKTRIFVLHFFEWGE